MSEKVKNDHERLWHYRLIKNGHVYNRDWNMPENRFSRVLGFAPETPEERKKKRLSGSRVIELALNEAFEKLGEGAAIRSGNYIDLITSWIPMQVYQHGKWRDLIDSAMHSHAENLDPLSRVLKPEHAMVGAQQYLKALHAYADEAEKQGYRYLEVQYKLVYLTKTFGTITGLMKTRHDAVMQALRGEQG